MNSDLGCGGPGMSPESVSARPINLEEHLPPEKQDPALAGNGAKRHGSSDFESIVPKLCARRNSALLDLAKGGMAWT
jgi:hypothetical protein